MPTPLRSFRIHNTVLAISATALGLLVFSAQSWTAGAAEDSSRTTDNDRQSLTFEKHIRPILAAKCFECHGEKTQKAELNLSSSESFARGGESGELLESDSPEDGLLYSMLAERDMPPEGKPQLSANELNTVLRWIRNGARFDQSDTEESASDIAVSEHDVIPILFRRCTMCHGPEYQEGGLDLRTRAAAIQGGKSGPAFVANKPQKSLMLERIRKRLCPPKEDLGQAGIEPTPADELEVLERWITIGAPSADADTNEQSVEQLVSDAERNFWSFQPPKAVKPPSTFHAELVRTPIDAFLLEQLEAAGVTYSPTADRLTLLRRATFDLTGLPPAPEEVTEFLQDEQPGAYERLIDRLLASPRYGERWGRYWLDLAGYADSEGKRSADMIRPFAYRYRDYVIRAFNDDVPYDRFLIEQIAGDELVDYVDGETLPADQLEKLIATGFLRMAPDGTSANPVNRLTDRIEVIADTVDVVSSGLMGLTMKCAQCHSHKYDPIPQRDYYRFVALFKGAFDEYDWMTPQPFNNQWSKSRKRFLKITTAEERQEWQEHQDTINAQIEALNAEQKALANNKTRANQIKAEVKSLTAQLRPEPMIRALWDRGRPSPTYMYRRGEPSQPGPLVDAGIPVVLTTGQSPFAIDPPQHRAEKTGRRLALAKWLTQPDHPLTARVFVNRVWKHHFGVGIVESLDNFGKLGTPPSHPELLDWLAIEFVNNGWSLKHLHRVIMTSTAYRQSSEVTDRQTQIDPENRLLSRMPMRRMDAEEVRDSILLIAGKLDERPFGPPDQVAIRKDGLVTALPSDSGWRRSVYIRQRRKEMPTILETFDLPQMNPNCVERVNSTIVSQPLHLLNNGTIHDLANSLAERLVSEVDNDRHLQIERAFLIALSRTPTQEEVEIAEQSLKDLERYHQHGERKSATEESRQLALADFCQALINSAAFLYID